jgi:signal recognition particle receptor subunit beta
MALIDLNKKQIQCKIVYYGPGRCGKTTNLLYIYNAMNEKGRGKLLTIETKGDRTLFFDLLPISLGKVGGFDIKMQLYTVPGQSLYETTRKLVLKGVDGLVFVSDSLRIRKGKNIESFQDMFSNLQNQHRLLQDIPLVLQYNKRDLVSSPIPTLSVEELENDLNRKHQYAAFEAIAVKGIGVFDTLKEICKITIRSVINRNLLNQKRT